MIKQDAIFEKEKEGIAKESSSKGVLNRSFELDWFVADET